jgi:hypothetical protein
MKKTWPCPVRCDDTVTEISVEALQDCFFKPSNRHWVFVLAAYSSYCLRDYGAVDSFDATRVLSGFHRKVGCCLMLANRSRSYREHCKVLTAATPGGRAVGSVPLGV